MSTLNSGEHHGERKYYECPHPLVISSSKLCLVRPHGHPTQAPAPNQILTTEKQRPPQPLNAQVNIRHCLNYTKLVAEKNNITMATINAEAPSESPLGNSFLGGLVAFDPVEVGKPLEKGQIPLYPIVGETEGQNLMVAVAPTMERIEAGVKWAFGEDKAEEMLKTVNATLAERKKKASQHDVMVELALAAIAEMDKIDGPNTIGLNDMITFLKSKEWDSGKNLWGGELSGFIEAIDNAEINDQEKWLLARRYCSENWCNHLGWGLLLLDGMTRDSTADILNCGVTPDGASQELKTSIEHFKKTDNSYSIRECFGPREMQRR